MTDFWASGFWASGFWAEGFWEEAGGTPPPSYEPAEDAALTQKVANPLAVPRT